MDLGPLRHGLRQPDYPESFKLLEAKRLQVPGGMGFLSRSWFPRLHKVWNPELGGRGAKPRGGGPAGPGLPVFRVPVSSFREFRALKWKRPPEFPGIPGFRMDMFSVDSGLWGGFRVPGIPGSGFRVPASSFPEFPGSDALGWGCPPRKPDGGLPRPLGPPRPPQPPAGPAGPAAPGAGGGSQSGNQPYQKSKYDVYMLLLLLFFCGGGGPLCGGWFCGG